MRITQSAILAMAVLLLAPLGWGQQCPDWSPYFDQIDDNNYLQMLQQQRSQGWTSINPANTTTASLQHDIESGEENIRRLQQGLREAEQAWAGTRGGNAPMPNPSAAECAGNISANLAAACQARADRNMLYFQEGFVDLLRCRAGMSPGSYGSLSSGSLDGGISSYPSSSSHEETAWNRGAASVADLNVSKRAGMVNSVTASWQPPVEQEVVQASQIQNASLEDPFAGGDVKSDHNPDLEQAASELSAGENSTTADGETVAQIPSTFEQAPDPSSSASSSQGTEENTSTWTDPFAKSSADTETAATYNDSSAVNEEQIKKALDTGVSNSNEASANDMASLPDSDKWQDFASTSAAWSSQDAADVPTVDADATTTDSVSDDDDRQITRDTQMAKVEAKALSNVLPSNAASKKVTKEMIGAFGSVAHEENHIINDLDSAMSGETPQSQIDSDLDRLPQAIGKGLVPGYKYLHAIDQDAAQVQNYVTRKVQSIECMFSFDPYCK